MSRYVIPALNKHYEITVGWDPPLRTFFGTVADRCLDDLFAPPYVFQVGQAFGAITEVMALVTALQAYAVVPFEVVLQLQADQQQPYERSPLQARMVQFFEGIVQPHTRRRR